MSKHRADQGHGWMKENHGEELKFVEDKQHETSMLMSKEENVDSVRDIEEHVKNELQKKKGITNAWFEKLKGKVSIEMQIVMVKTN